MLTDTLIKPAEGSRRAPKDYRVIKEQVSALREALDAPDAFMAMTNVVEQACNSFLETEEWPATYEELQPVPVLKAGMLSFAGDDGMVKGQTYRARIDARHVCDVATHQVLASSCICVPLTKRERGSGGVCVGSSNSPSR